MAGQELVKVNSEAAAISQPAPEVERIKNALLANVAESSQRVYKIDAAQFLTWLSERGLTPATADYETMSDYRAYLAAKYEKNTAARKLVVARRLLDVAVILNQRQDNPAQHVKGIKSGHSETTHRALTKAEAKELLGSIDTSTNKGKRDYALILLLIRTGIRRAEAVGLELADLKIEQGYHVAIIRHGKGDKRRTVKLPVDVLRAISDYLEATDRKSAEPAAPVFSTYRGRSEKPTNHPMTGLDIERIVKGYAGQLNIEGLTPHGLRASFVTLALEAGAALQKVQYAAGHADPRTTERYQRRKLNLDDNAVDYIKL